MRIVSWNVNGIGRRYAELIQLVDVYQPDVIFLQKVRNPHGNISYPLEGYRGLWRIGDSADNSGVATYCKASVGLEFCATPQLTEKGHFQMFKTGGIYMCNAYVPFSNILLPESIDFRKKWDVYLLEVATRLSKEYPLMILGDMNIVHTAQDNDCNSSLRQRRGCYFDWERDNFDRLLADAKLVDSFRALHPSEIKYSYFHTAANKSSNLGWRIDYALVSETLMADVVTSDILTDFGSSPSAPIILELRPHFFGAEMAPQRIQNRERNFP